MGWPMADSAATLPAAEVRRRPLTLPADRGAATVMVMALVGVALIAGMALAWAAGLAVSRASAQGAADLAASSAARVARDQRATGVTAIVPCDIAAQVVSANGADLVACKVSAPVVTVTVQGRSVTATATAGPAYAGIGVGARTPAPVGATPP